MLKNEKFKSKIKEELADILIYLILLAEATGIDLQTAVIDKMKSNKEKYPKKEVSGNKFKELLNKKLGLS